MAPVAAQFTSFILDAITGIQDFLPQVDSQRMNRFKKSALKKWQLFTIALSFSTMVVMVGCGDDGSGLGRRYKVEGKVTYKGAPVSHGTVNFIPTKPPSPEGRAASGQIKDGHYALSTTGNDDGALPGEYNVAIVAMDIDMASAVSKEGLPKIHEGDEAYQKAVKNAKKLIPDKYGVSETSGLKATVDSSGKTHDFELTD